MLIVDGDAETRSLIARLIRLDGYEATEASDFETAVSLCRQSSFDLMILDVEIPGVDGFSVLRTVRTFSQMPILILSALCSEEHRIRGLEEGADDYMAKPFATKELMLRVAAILRRGLSHDKALPQTLVSEQIRIDLTARRVFVDERQISLTPKEFDLLVCLMRSPGLVMSREQLLVKCWGSDYEGEARAVDTHIRRLRDKLGSAAGCIKTVIKAGYKLEV